MPATWASVEVKVNDAIAAATTSTSPRPTSSFGTVNGCIFEEVSTTHVVGDSYYEDPKVAALDPMQRKTILSMW